MSRKFGELLNSERKLVMQLDDKSLREIGKIFLEKSFCHPKCHCEETGRILKIRGDRSRLLLTSSVKRGFSSPGYEKGEHPHLFLIKVK